MWLGDKVAALYIKESYPAITLSHFIHTPPIMNER